MYPMNYGQPFGMTNAFGQDNMGPWQRLMGRFHPQTGGALPPMQGYNTGIVPPGMGQPAPRTGGPMQSFPAFHPLQRVPMQYGPYGPSMGGI